jgi:hypothetical protein
MRHNTIATALMACAVVTALPVLPQPALAQDAPKPSLSVDTSKLPPLPPIVPAEQREQMVLVATGAGAAIGVILADIVTGGLLLAPLGIPSAASLVSFGGGAAAVAPPTYSVAQRLLAGVASIAAAVGGGYLGGYVARSRPDLVGLQE